jgi:hypothetical protein
MFFIWAFTMFNPGTVALRNRYGYNRGRYAPRDQPYITLFAIAIVMQPASMS